MNEAKELGRKIRKEREKMGLSPKEFAEMVPISRTQLINIELGHNIPRSSTLARISRITGKPAEYFVGHVKSHEQEINELFEKEAIEKNRLPELGLIIIDLEKLRSVGFEVKKNLLRQLGALKKTKKEKK